MNTYNINDINDIKSKLNIYNVQDNINDNRQQIHIEITLTNACNMNCKYCFEHNYRHQSNINEEETQLKLIEELCINFDTLKFNKLQIVFWGGEPTLNMPFMYKIIEKTYKYQFVNYFMYSNGSLIDIYKEFIQNDVIQQIKSRFRIQLSYDGEPIHSIERNYNSQIVLDVATLLQQNNFNFSFKATVSGKTFKYMPLAWKSYEQLYKQFGNSIVYSPTIDMTSIDFEKYIDDWKNAINQIIKYEYSFIRQHNRFLLNWFNYQSYNDNKLTCNKDYACHLHTDGNIYICHGCPYINSYQKFIVSNTNKIHSLYDVLCKHSYGKRDDKCFDCEAVFCNFCHIYHVNDNDIFNTWLSSINNNKIRCQYFKYVGIMKKLLDFILIDSIKSK